MKVKVPVATLIERVAAARKRVVDAHLQAVKEYPALEKAYRKEIVRALDDAKRKIAAGGKLPETQGRWNGRTTRDTHAVLIPIRVAQPDKPTKAETHRFDRRLKDLRLSSATELLVDPSDHDWRGIL